MDQIFQLQDQIITRLLKSLALEKSDSEMYQIERPQTRDLEAYEYCAKARQLIYRMAGKEIEEAIESGRKAVELDPDNPQALYFLAVAHWLRGLIEFKTDGHVLAAQHLKRVIELAPRYQPGNQILGAIYFNHGQYEQAWEHTKNAAEIEESGDWELGRFVGAISFLAKQAYRLGKLGEAQRLVNRALEVSGEVQHVYTPACNALTYCVQGDPLLKTQRPDEALSAFRHAKEQVSRSPRSLGIGWPMLRAHVGLARAFRAIGMKNESDASLREARSLFDTKDGYDFSGLWDSGEVVILVELAVFYAGAHNRDEALNLLEKAVELGWLETPRLELESSFQNLCEDPRFQAIQNKLRRQSPIP